MLHEDLQSESLPLQHTAEPVLPGVVSSPGGQDASEVKVSLMMSPASVCRLMMAGFVSGEGKESVLLIREVDRQGGGSVMV